MKATSMSGRSAEHLFNTCFRLAFESEFILFFSVLFLSLREPEGVLHNGEDTSLTKGKLSGILRASVLAQ